MTSAHIFFIPGMIIIGMFFGFIFGARAARNQIDMERKREDERLAAREARAARRAEAAGNKVDDRPPAEAKSAEVESERKDEGAVAEEKPAPSEKKADEKPEPKKTKGKKH